MPPSQPRQSQPSAPPQTRRLDPKIWRACAGVSVKIPTLHSRVYYFPQGHLEHASSTPRHLPPIVLSRPFIHCRISDVHLLADRATDEVFAKLFLQPTREVHPQDFGGSVESPDDDKVVSVVKILTPSDANNGGGFSVPRFCADSIFPPLNLQADQPVQILSVTDVHGACWEFRHIYRGTPRRHLLTTGWSKFVNNKKLIAGDSVVFMKNSRGEMFVGIRRVVRFAAGNGGDSAIRCPPIGGGRAKVEEEEQEQNCEGFSRNGRGKLSAKSVVEAAELAAQNMPFEVVYYPRAGWSDFVVKAEAMEDACDVVWTEGMRVKMTMETEDSSRMTWFQGTVSLVSVPKDGPWRGSPWRMLQVTWDEPEVLQNAKRVSPWQVEQCSPTLPFPPTKRFRASNDSGLLIDQEGDHFFPMTGFPNSATAYMNQPLLNCDVSPAGMQGARHDHFSVPRISNSPSDNTHLGHGNSFGNNTVPKSKTVPTELNIQSGNSTKLGAGSILLFGAIIQTEQPVESDLQSPGYTGANFTKCCDETEGIVNPQLDHSLTNSKLLNRLWCPTPKSLGS